MSQIPLFGELPQHVAQTNVQARTVIRVHSGQTKERVLVHTIPQILIGTGSKALKQTGQLVQVRSRLALKSRIKHHDLVFLASLTTRT